ncbi:hypothetical protein [Mycobacterium lacus]|nr:hypothetical protein [Mycobacterium lacus]
MLEVLAAVSNETAVALSEIGIRPDQAYRPKRVLHRMSAGASSARSE